MSKEYEYPLHEAIRFLWFARQTGITEDGRIEARNTIPVIRETTGISAFSPEPEAGISLLVRLGLAGRSNGRLRLTEMGLELSTKIDSPTVLSDDLRTFLLEYMQDNKPWGDRLRHFLSMFRRDEGGRLVHESQLFPPNEDLEVSQLLQEMRVVRIDEDMAVLDESILVDLDDPTVSWLPISQEEFDELIQERKRLGDIAEQHAEKWEIRRLEFLGHPELGPLVSRVSQSDVSRGYDIRSVDGDNGSEEDRFIEVKCSVGERIRFFWTAREMQVARQHGNKYWIYFLPKIRQISEDTRIAAIRNPIGFLGDSLEIVQADALVNGDKLIRRYHEDRDLGRGLRGRFWERANVDR